MKEVLDGLLTVDVVLHQTPHNWLARPPVSPTANQIKLMLQKRSYLTTLGVETWEMGSLHPNRQKRLATLARSRTNQVLSRLADYKRYPMLVAFCQEAYITLTDYVLRLFDKYWEDTLGRANRELIEYQLKQIKSKDGALVSLGKAAQPIVDEINVPADQLRQRIYTHVSRQELLEAIELMLNLTKSGPRTFHYYLANRYRVIKSFSAHMLAGLRFEHTFTGDDFAKALTLVEELQSGRRRKLPDDPPRRFILPSWQAFDQPAGKHLERSAYELSVLARLRDKLRSGDVYVHHSRKYCQSGYVPDASSVLAGASGRATSLLGLPRCDSLSAG